jgi:hypothetical protein
MKARVFEVIGIFSLLFALFLVGLTVYKSIFFINKYFPGFFIYYNKVINSYDAPENWNARIKKIPYDAVLKKIDDRYVDSVHDFWEVVEKNKDRQKEFVVEYISNGERYISFFISQKFTFEDYIKFAFSWQFSGLLFVLLGTVILFGNKGKKGLLWFLASTVLGFNFITTPMASFLSENMFIILIERLSFATFPALVLVLFLEFPLRKFSRSIRSFIVPLASSISISFLVVSILALFTEEAATIQVSYYVYPGVAGLFGVFASVYDYVRAVRRKNQVLVSNYVFPSVLASSTFLLIPSVIAVLITFFDIPSYYIPSIMAGYPIVISAFTLRKSFYFLRLVVKDLVLIIVISAVLSVVFWLLFVNLNFLAIFPRFLLLVTSITVIGVIIYSILRNVFVARSGAVYDLTYSVIEEVISRLKDLNDVPSFHSFVNGKLAGILGVSFARFIPHNVMEKVDKRKLYYFPGYFVSTKDVGKLGFTFIRRKKEFFVANYIGILKVEGKFFGCVLMGKRILGDPFSGEELELLDNLMKLLSYYFYIIVLSTTSDLPFEELKRLYMPYFDKLFAEISMKEEFLSNGTASLRCYLCERYEGYRPSFYKVKEFDGDIYFCLLWIPSKDVMSYILISILKGVVDYYFSRGLKGVNINRLPREIRNVMASITRGIDIDLNITTGFVKKGSMIMNVVNDGKTSIFLQTNKGAVVPMPKQKRLFEFNKIKEGDTFFFVASEDVLLQFEEMQNMEVRKFNFEKFVRSQKDVAILEVSFHGSPQ